MERSLIYNGTITAEQFLFYEIRIASKYYLDGTSVEDAIEEISVSVSDREACCPHGAKLL